LAQKQYSSAEDQALAWLIRSHSGEMTSEEQLELSAWLRASPVHREAYAEAERLWADAGHLIQDRFTGLVRPRPKRDPRVSTRVLVGTAAAASITGVCLCLVVAFGLHWRLLADRTTVIEPQNWTLADGSRLHLDADTALSLHYSKHERRVTLHRGACWFTVAPDPRRPFRVVFGDRSVTALGTDFLVDLREYEPYIMVSEHAVEASEKDRRLRIEQGEALHFGSDPGNWLTEVANPQGTGSFRNGHLVVENQPLGEVAAKLSRYRHGFLKVYGDVLAKERISGVFDLHHPERALDALTQILPVKLIRIPPFLIFITPA
jgi:transmembrane sensor